MNRTDVYFIFFKANIAKKVGNMKNIKVALLATGVFFSFVAQAEESVAQANLRVHVKVARTCYVQDADLNFGTIDGLFRLDSDASTDIIVRCTADAPYDLSLNAGNNFLNGSRRMVDDNNQNFIAYTLYQPDNTTLWDNDHRLSSIATGNDQTFTVHGVIPSGQTSVPGDRNYNDYVTIDLYMASALDM